MIDNLRKEHFALGCQNPMFAKSSTIIGGGAAKTAHPSKAPWAHLRTNYVLGTDKEGGQTDYQSRFQNSKGLTERGQSSPAQDAIKNKFKNSYATVKLEGSTRGFDPTTSMKTQFHNVSQAGRKINTGLDDLTTSYITGSHFKTGYGGFGGVSEQKGKFQ